MENYTNQQKWVLATIQSRYQILKTPLSYGDFPRTFYAKCLEAFGSFESACKIAHVPLKNNLK